MQRIDRRVEIAVLLLRRASSDSSFALIFFGHGVPLAEKRDEVATGFGSLWKEYRPCQPGPQASEGGLKVLFVSARRSNKTATWNSMDFQMCLRTVSSPHAGESAWGGLRINAGQVPCSRLVTYDGQI